jgi:hypothetical protein
MSASRPTSAIAAALAVAFGCSLHFLFSISREFKHFAAVAQLVS